MAAPTEEINSILIEQITNFSTAVETREVGSVIQIGDGIARVYGLGNVGALELVEFTKHGVMGIALNLEEESVGVMVVGPYTQIEEGDEVRRTGRIASVPVGDELIGRVVNPLGEPLDGKGPMPAGMGTRPVEVIAPGVMLRSPVEHAGADRHQGDRRHDPDRPRPARADHRRPSDGQDRDRARHDHQSARRRPDLHLRRDRPEGVVDRRGGRHPRAGRRDGAHHRRRRFGPATRPRCSTWRRSPAARWASTSCGRARTR